MNDRRWWKRLVLLLFLSNSLVIRMGRRQTSREGSRIGNISRVEASSMSTAPPTSLVAEHVPDIVKLLNTNIPMLLVIRLLATKL
jgi:hypothetical protein